MTDKATIMIVDDHQPTLVLLTAILRRGGYEAVHVTTEPHEALGLFERVRPDLVLLDFHLPGTDGIEVMEQLRAAATPGEFLPIVIITGEGSRDAENRAVSGGAADFLSKPFSATEVLLRARNLLQMRALSLANERRNQDLERRVRARTRELDESRREILQRLALAAEYRDDATGQHAQRVADLSARIASQLGWRDDDVELLHRAALLHDVGKIGLADEILLKPGRFTPEEYERMKEHTTIGAELLAGSHSAVLQMAELVARTHHERWDGRGYGGGLAGEEIPMAGRIVAVADVFDALTTARPYKPAWSLPETLAEIEAQRGKQFDPSVVDALLAVMAAASADEPAAEGNAIFRLVDTLAGENQSLRWSNGRDELTGLVNRRGLDDALHTHWRRGAGAQAALSLLMIDLDHFKTTNDTRGHLEGDAVLRKVAKVLTATVRREGDVTARFGGDEFAVLLPDTDLEGALAVARNLRMGVAAAVAEGQRISISIGVASCVPQRWGDPATLLAHADAALYTAKARGRGRVEAHAPATQGVEAVSAAA
ncbi:MAG TPA: diguanylate cyclase [Chloroflexota bacterium]|nr:diguanylate cyclase [Chloroflexota bacterium]